MSLVLLHLACEHLIQIRLQAYTYLSINPANMAKGKQNATTSKRKRADKDPEQSAVVSKRPVLQPSTGMNIPSGQTPSLSGREDSDDSLTPEPFTSQQEAFERLKRLNEELMKSNEQLKQDKLGLKKEQNRAQGGCASTELRSSLYSCQIGLYTAR